MFKYNLYKILFENTINSLDNNLDDVFQFRDEWYPIDKDWSTMIMNMNKHHNLYNIFSHIKDMDKLVRYCLVAKAINYPYFREFYNKTLYNMLFNVGLKYDEVKLVENKNIPIPNEYQDLINDLIEYDKMGGVSLAFNEDQDLGDFVDDPNIFNALNKLKNLSEFQFMRLTYDTGDWNRNIRIIKLTFSNDYIAYIRIDKIGKNCYHLKTIDYSHKNIDKYRLASSLSIYMAPYEDGIKCDQDYMIFNLEN